MIILNEQNALRCSIFAWIWDSMKIENIVAANP